jgi:hypothetical protein
MAMAGRGNQEANGGCFFGLLKVWYQIDAVSLCTMPHHHLCLIHVLRCYREPGVAVSDSSYAFHLPPGIPLLSPHAMRRIRCVLIRCLHVRC